MAIGEGELFNQAHLCETPEEKRTRLRERTHPEPRTFLYWGERPCYFRIKSACSLGYDRDMEGTAENVREEKDLVASGLRPPMA